MEGGGTMDTPRHERSLRWVEVPSDLSRGRRAQRVHLQQQERKKIGLGTVSRAWGGP